MDDRLLILMLHAVATALMGGLIWFVQVVHYPLLRRVGRDAFVSYERHHVQRTGWLVGPLMLVEAAMTVIVLVRADALDVPATWAWIGAALLAIIWLSTALLQVPCHRRLESGFDERTWGRLVSTNWFRTAAWSGRTLLALAMLARAGAA